eukprot:193125_1
MSPFQKILFFSISIYFGGSIEYNGPADQVYFQQESATISNTMYTIESYMFDNTQISAPVNYYNFNLSLINQYCSNAHITTCCPYEFVVNNSYLHPRYCGNASLDTVLYLLREKRGQISLLEISDDTKKSKCSNTNKSIIDISAYDEGIYYLGVGGFAQDTGDFFIYLKQKQNTFVSAITFVTSITCVLLVGI